jgi:trans-aconitate 2-methyltransferase
MAAEWKWDASDYARNSSAQQSWALALLESLALSGAEVVLDIGCGDGKVTAEIARRVPKGSVLGVDSAEGMIGLAMAGFPPERYPNLGFQVTDALSLPFRDRFDIVFSNAALHWVKDQAAVLRGVAAALKRGGRALLQMGGRGNAEEIFAVAAEMISRGEWSGYFGGFEPPWGFYAPEDYRPWCRKAGLDIARVELLPRDMLQKGVDGLAGWIRTTWMPYTQRLPVDRREPFIREAAERYVAVHPANERGEIAVRMVRLELDARKA